LQTDSVSKFPAETSSNKLCWKKTTGSIENGATLCAVGDTVLGVPGLQTHYVRAAKEFKKNAGKILQR